MAFMADFQQLLNEARRAIAAGLAVEARRLLQAALRLNTAKPFEYEVIGRLLVGLDVANHPEVSIAVLSDVTAEPICNAVRCAACCEGRQAGIYEAPFASVQQEILNPTSGLYSGHRDIVLLAVHKSALKYAASRLKKEKTNDVAEEIKEQFVGYWRRIHEKLNATIWQHNYEPTGLWYTGPSEANFPESFDRFLAVLNEKLRNAAPPYVRWLDVAGAAERVGVGNWSDARLYFHGKYGFQPKYIDVYYRMVAGLFGIQYGSNAKVLVTDLDQTLWGGIIGDDGLEGIELGPSSPAGEAYEALCHYLLELNRRGVILAVCSKNDPQIAGSVFLRHPHMPIKPDDFAAVHCSWEDKATGLKTIADQLNLGLNHFVFMDDNPAECELVRMELPDVRVIELKGDPAGFIDLIDKGHWFDTARISSEDIQRSASYQALNSARKLQTSHSDLNEYLKSLEMSATYSRAKETDIPRLAQMEAKTNQFNTTTRRYDESALASFMARDDARLYVCRLKDKFADHGLVSYLLVLDQGDEWKIESWLMSCRVFSRSLEHFIFGKLLNHAAHSNVSRLIAEYIPTDRNSVIADLFPKLGFKQEAGRELSLWILDVQGTQQPETAVQEVE